MSLLVMFFSIWQFESMIGWLKRLFAPRSGDIDLDHAEGRKMSGRIRLYAANDFAACCELYVLNEPGRFPSGVLPYFESDLRDGATLFLIAEDGGEIRGCAGITIRTDGIARASLSYGLVHPNYQKRGFGTALLLARLSLLSREPWPVVLVPVPASESFYKRFGFQELAQIKLLSGHEMPLYVGRISPDDLERCDCLLRNAGVELSTDGAVIPIRSS